MLFDSDFKAAVWMRLLLCALAITAISLCAASPVGKLVPYKGSYAFAMNLTVVQQRVQCYGPDFATRVGHPSAILTDFYGLQALRDLGVARVAADARSLRLEIVKTLFNIMISVRFPSVPTPITADFYFGVPILVRDGLMLNHSFAEVHADNDCQYLELVQNFRNSVRNLGLTGYMSLNPYYAIEIRAQKYLNGTLPAPPVNWGPINTFDKLSYRGKDVLVVVPDRVHGADTDAYNAIQAAILSPEVEWLALEMITNDLQQYVDIYLNTEDIHSPEFVNAQRVLASAVNQYYFSLLRTMRAVGKKQCFAVDAPLYYNAFRYGEFSFGAAARNIMWTQNINLFAFAGRGAIMGGSAHFNDPLSRVFGAAVSARNQNMNVLRFSYPEQQPDDAWQWVKRHWWLFVSIAGGVAFAALIAWLVVRRNKTAYADSLGYRSVNA